MALCVAILYHTAKWFGLGAIHEMTMQQEGWLALDAIPAYKKDLDIKSYVQISEPIRL